MTSTRARHRATVSPFHWASRSVVAVAAVPVGALVGCVAAAASTDTPVLGLAGLTVAAVPLALHAWHVRRAEAAAAGRHAVSAATAKAAGLDALLASMAEPSAAARIPAPRRAVDAVLGAARSVTPARAADSRSTLTLPEDLIDLRPDLPLEYSTRAQRDQEIAKLRQLWDSGTGPEAGAAPAAQPATADTAA